MKKIVYGIIACIIVIGAVIIFTLGLKVDTIYSKNVEIDIYIGKVAKIEEIKQLAKEVFPEEKIIVQKIEMFDDMVSITMQDKTEEELKDKVEQLNTKINEKYGTDNKVENNITIVHNPKVKLTSILKPYLLPIGISLAIILVLVGIGYRKLGIIKTVSSYVIYTAIVEALYLSLIAITRFPINRLVIPFGLVLYIITVTSLSFINERKLSASIQLEKTKKKK